MPVIELLQLPVPGQTLGPDREIRIEEFTMQVYLQLLGQSRSELLTRNWTNFSTHHITIPMLKDRLFAYGCPISGSKSQLIDRLRKFAADRDHWAV